MVVTLMALLCNFGQIFVLAQTAAPTPTPPTPTNPCYRQCQKYAKAVNKSSERTCKSTFFKKEYPADYRNCLWTARSVYWQAVADCIIGTCPTDAPTASPTAAPSP